MENSDIISLLLPILEEKEFKKKLIDKINNSVDIPMINEKTEKKVFNNIYKIIINCLEDLKID
jgi:hypothetical protein|tara:strand:- start:445 stop:633 length:189 start_codon:yes stop_codon:yes gene_type:complete